jgi:hypothetical protein
MAVNGDYTQAALRPGKETLSIDWVGGWVDPNVGDTVEKGENSLPLLEIELGPFNC